MINPFEPSIYKRPEVPKAENPYFGDELGRRKLANQLEAYIDRLPDGAVISIDASWGQGKTWFALNWHNDWKSKSRKSIYIDAFKSDFIEDPFVMITGEIVSELDESGGTKSSLIDASVNAAKTLLPVVAVGLLNTGIKILTGANDAAGVSKIAADAFAEESQKAFSEGIRNSIESYSKKKSDLNSFNEILKKAVDKNIDGNPLLIFIDELDRCRPDFAIKTIERIKHYFDVPGIIFILLMNRNQMLETIKGAYGAGIDAETYIRKFVQLNVSFPKVRIGHDPSVNINNYCLSTMARHGFKRNNQSESFSLQLSILSHPMNLTLRDLENCIALYSIARPDSETGGFNSYCLAIPIALKVKYPDIFQKMMDYDKKAFAIAVNLINEVIANMDGRNAVVITAWAKYLEALGPSSFVLANLQNGDMLEVKNFNHALNIIMPPADNHVEPREIFQYYARRIDLDIY